jgi:catechol 2,3-dioxygenase-like lactoylglutathione lyase family enzyme
MAVYAIGDGRSIDFFTYEGIQRPPADDLPRDIRHVGLAIASREALNGWKRRLERHGVDYAIEDHGDDEHVYFTDPNGVMFELTIEAETLGAREPAVEAGEIVRRWIQSHERRSS